MNSNIERLVKRKITSSMESYPSGLRGAPAKGVDRLNCAGVRIPCSPPKKSKQIPKHEFDYRV